MKKEAEYPTSALEDIKNSSFTSFLDLARWFAAAMVFVGHLRNPLFLGYGGVLLEDRNILVQFWYFVTGWYGEAVIVFFVLSGYLVGGLGSAKVSKGRFSLSGYGIDRATRLFVAFWPALILTFLLDVSGASLFSSSGFYDHTHPMLLQKIQTESFESFLTAKNFLMNAMMLQTFHAPPFGSNQPFWTISIEFWFYVVFGLGVAGLLARSNILRFIPIVLLLIVFVFLGIRFPVYLGLWLIGVMAAFVPWRVLERPLLSLLLFVLILIFTRLRQDLFSQGFMMISARNYLVAFSFAWLLVSMRRVDMRLLTQIGPLNKFLADFSYSLYLIHYPLMLFFLGALHATGYFDVIALGYRPTSPEGLFLYGVVILAVFFCAWGFAQITEERTGSIRRAIKAKLSPQ